MRLLPWFDKKRSRREWEAGLTWFRVRYLDANGLARCIRLLSSAHVCGRVAIYYVPHAAVSRLYVGVPTDRNELLQRMSADLNFSITVSPDVQPPPISLLAPAEQLPWDRPFYTHIVEGHLFIDGSEDEKNAEQGSYLPLATKRKEAPTEWRLLQPPAAGLSLKPSWNGHRAQVEFSASNAGAPGWPLGRSQDGVPIYAGGSVNVYGGAGTAAGWLARLVEHLLHDKPHGLIVIDGKGDLVPVLKRKAVVTRLLGKQLTHVDVDGAVVAGGFNPLAPGESDAETLQRWQRWFSNMSVHQEGLQLLARAVADGVTDITSLQRWLQQPSQQYYAVGVSSLQSALRRLQADPVLREWLSWPTNIFTGLPEGVLLLACRRAGWGREQLLAAAALAALSFPEARLVLHGFPWSASGFTAADFEDIKQLVASNGPCMQECTVVLTRSGPQTAQKLARRFLGDDVLAEENLQILEEGSGIVVHGGQGIPVQWQP